MQAIELPSGYEMPVIGLGTWKLNGKECIDATSQALKLGYRQIDTAYVYGNQNEIGEAITGFDRSKIFITSKVWKDSLTYGKVLGQTDEILQQLGTDYVDLLLVHWPSEDGVPVEETLSAFGEIIDQGKARSIGVSNFTVKHLEEAIEVADIPISNNQIKFNLHEKPEDILEFCSKHGISVTAYSPLEGGAVGSGGETVREVASMRGKTPAQVALRWLLQKGMIVIPKSSSRTHLEENLAILDWELSREEMKALDDIR